MRLFVSHSCILALVTTLALSSLDLQIASAQSNRAKFPQLSIGMTTSQVLQAWGLPDDKTVRETRRQERWDYGKRQVLFENGNVVRWRGDDAQTAYRSSANGMNPGVKSNAASDNMGKIVSARNEDASHLLDSIFMELPKDGGGEPATANNSMPPGHPNPADVVSEEEEP